MGTALGMEVRSEKLESVVMDTLKSYEKPVPLKRSVSPFHTVNELAPCQSSDADTTKKLKTTRSTSR
jgi:hypothetical protein